MHGGQTKARVGAGMAGVQILDMNYAGAELLSSPRSSACRWPGVSHRDNLLGNQHQTTGRSGNSNSRRGWRESGAGQDAATAPGQWPIAVAEQKAGGRAWRRTGGETRQLDRRSDSDLELTAARRVVRVDPRRRSGCSPSLPPAVRRPSRLCRERIGTKRPGKER
jgi:hypothetical protein